ncbi:MAG: hypothetical protein CBC82_10330 [Cellvibrionales bacterium TMED122]|nr:MAG: hypothetical protein CBC82_10330 [Cellvibrionales bacterium TMED122]|tara:strand:+ start:477 stop:1169 length:693 start_codon:yes stop_codon:yes gene_type:complete
MDKEKLVSVILSTYNSEDTLEESINSILNQTYLDIEILIMDDGSEDNTPNILERISARHQSLKIYRNKTNIGLTRSLNILIDKSNGKYIARQDADDISHPERIKIQIDEIEKNNLDFCSSRAFVKESNRKIPGLSFFLPKKIMMKYKNPFIHGTLVIKKNILKDVGNYDENFYYSQDYKLMKDLINYKCNYKVLKTPLYILNTKNNISTKKLDEQDYYAECVRKNIIPKI